jgi:hypothetical protein
VNETVSLHFSSREASAVLSFTIMMAEGWQSRKKSRVWRIGNVPKPLTCILERFQDQGHTL